ncbi:MAG: ABC transporter permease [Planctomycetota bacterium]|nr:ABC transporter permease [Planctomycetota bacterium]
MRSIFIIAIKDLRLLWRDKLGLFWVIFFPLMMAVFFGSLFGGLGRRAPLPVIIVDEDKTDRSRDFIQRLYSADSVRFIKPDGSEAPPNQKIDVAQIGSRNIEDAEAMVRKSEVAAYVRLKPGFGKSLGFMPNIQFMELGVDPARRVEAGILQGVIMDSYTAPLRDMTRDPEVAKKSLAQAREDIVTSGIYTFRQQKGLRDFIRAFERLVVPEELDEEVPGADTTDDSDPATPDAPTSESPTGDAAEASTAEPAKGGEQAISGEQAKSDGGAKSGDSAATSSATESDEKEDGEPPASSIISTSAKIVEVRPEHKGPNTGYEISFPQSITWGIFGCLSVFAISLVQEQTQGTYLRLRVAPISRAQILAGKGFACWLACCTVSVLLIIFGRLVFRIEVDNPKALALAIVCSSFCFVGVMMFASVLGRSERAVGGSVWAINMPLAMLGGSMIPLVVMPPWMQTASSFSPVKWMILALEGAIWRGFSMAEMALPCLILIAFGVGTYIIGLLILLQRDS